MAYVDGVFSSLFTNSSSVVAELSGIFPGRGSAIYTTIPPESMPSRPNVPASQSGMLIPCILAGAIMFVEFAVVQGVEGRVAGSEGVGTAVAGTEVAGRII
jgi:hypothetical protein